MPTDVMGGGRAHPRVKAVVPPASVPIREYVDARIADSRDAHEREHAIEREAERQAREVLASVMAARFDSVNEFRAAMGDQAARLMPRDSYEAQYAALVQRLETTAALTADRIAAVEAQATKSAIVVGVISGLVGLMAGALVIPIISHFLMGG